MDDDFGYDYDEFNDPDATSCANGDYNAWEDEQVFQDGVAEREADDRDYLRTRIAREIAREVVGDATFNGALTDGDFYAADRILAMMEEYE